MRGQWMRTILVAALLLPVLTALHPAPAVSAADVPDPRFGVIEAHAAPWAASALGAGWTRITFRWNEIQPAGPDDWNVVPISDQTLANELAQGRQVVGLLVTTPGWATDTSVGPGVPKGLYLPVDDPGNLWASYVRTIVSRYAGRIDHWIIWNEPDIPDTHHMSWGGSIEDFVQLLRVAYTVANETNPSAVIHMAAVTHWWNEHWFGQFLEALVAAPGAAANDYFFDIATLHIYFQPETVYDITAHYQQLMQSRGIHKPIWIAETNAAPSRDPAWSVPSAQFDVSLEEQAFFMVQAFSLGIAAGAERIAVYKMADTETDRAANPEPFGLVRMDGSHRPAFTAYQVATNYLAGFRGGTWDRRDEISLVTVDRGIWTTTVVWSRTPEPQTAMIPARTTRALLVDVWGTAYHIYPERGYYFIDLPGARCAQGCLIGGAPYMLVEQAPAGADTAPTPRSPTPVPDQETGAGAVSGAETPPTATPTSTATVTATPSPTATSSPTPTATPTPTVTPTPTATSTSTSTPAPTPTSPSTPAPSPTPIPVAMSGISSRRPWLLIGVMAAVIGGAALAADRGARRASLRRVRRRPVAQSSRSGSVPGSDRCSRLPSHVGSAAALTALTAVLLLISRTVIP